MEEKQEFEAILTFVNKGFTDLVMDAAREAGARGGTVLNARGTGDKLMAKKFGVAITPEKELVIILVNKKIKEAVMSAIYKAAGLDTNGHGITFSVPVEDVAGLNAGSDNSNA